MEAPSRPWESNDSARRRRARSHFIQTALWAPAVGENVGKPVCKPLSRIGTFARRMESSTTTSEEQSHTQQVLQQQPAPSNLQVFSGRNTSTSLYLQQHDLEPTRRTQALEPGESSSEEAALLPSSPWFTSESHLVTGPQPWNKVIHTSPPSRFANRLPPEEAPTRTVGSRTSSYTIDSWKHQEMPSKNDVDSCRKQEKCTILSE